MSKQLSVIIVQQTFVIIKPDAIERSLIGEIISRFEHKYLRIIAMQQRWKTKEWCLQHYSHLHHNHYENIYLPLEDFMLASPIIGIILQGPDAIRVVKNMIGCTDSLMALPGTIRGDYGNYPIRYNVVHAASSKEDVAKEIDLFFNNETDLNNNE